MIHTYATLEVSPTTYNEIAEKLKEAGYQHAFMENGDIDMHGVGLIKGKSYNEETLERLKYEIKNGESSLDTAMRVHAVLKDFDKGLWFKFNSAYTKYINDDTEIETELLERLYQALIEAPIYIEPKNEVENIMSKLSTENEKN